MERGRVDDSQPLVAFDLPHPEYEMGLAVVFDQLHPSIPVFEHELAGAVVRTAPGPVTHGYCYCVQRLRVSLCR